MPTGTRNSYNNWIQSLNLFPEGEEHQIPSIREWERAIFDSKGKVSVEEIEKIFAEGKQNENADNEFEDKNAIGLQSDKPDTREKVE